jgi:hypothetical protein
MTLEANTEYEELLEATIKGLAAALASKQKLLDTAHGDAAFQNGLLNSFWTGNIPDDATLEHLVLAKAGRQRLEEKAKRCALLSPSS